MPDDDLKKFSVTVIMDVAKQLVTIASAFIVVTATVINLFIRKDEPGYGIDFFWLAITSWVASLICIIAGILALGAISTSAHDLNEYNVDAPFTKWSLRIQQLAFLSAFIFFACFAALNAGS